MRRVYRFWFVALFFCASLSVVQGQAQRPRFRPAVLGSGPTSLINRINSTALFQAGQKEGAVMFSARVAKDGRLVDSQTYQGTPNTTALEQEIKKLLLDTKVAPAIYEHQPVEVYFYGTVVFSVAEDKPHVRIFLNQDPAELKKESDFIAPQPVFGADSKFAGLSYPQGGQTLPVSGSASLTLRVDANGVPQEIRLLAEAPPLLNFGRAALADFQGVKFIPAFRDGDPTACETVLPIYYHQD
jgi:TonB family protein